MVIPTGQKWFHLAKAKQGQFTEGLLLGAKSS